MYSLFIEILFCAVASVISSEFYVAYSGRKTPKICMMLMIFVTHMVVVLPCYKEYGAILNLIQIVSEFVIIIMIIDDKILQKLLMYVELNVAFGIASIAAYIFKDNKIMYFLLTLIVAGLICYTMIYFHNRSKKNIKNINGKAISFSVCMAMLCCLYTIAVVMNSLEKKLALIIYICFLGVIISVYELLIINEKIRRNEMTGRKHFVIKKLNEKADILAEHLHNEALNEIRGVKNARNKLNYLYGSLPEVEKIRSLVLVNKIEKAEKCGCVVNILGDVTSNLKNVGAFEYVTIFANLFDNAIEAAAKNSKDKRWISIVMKDDFFSIENPYEEQLIVKNNHFFTTKKEEGHGLGLQNVSEIVEEIGLKIDINVTDGIFKVHIG